MWVVEACFEGSEQPLKKLLKPGKRYSIGRKAPADLILADKTVSQDAGYLEVAAWTLPPASRTDAGRLPPWPYLRIHVGKKLIRAIPRDEETQWQANRDSFIGEEVDPGSEREMEDGDRIIPTRSCPPLRTLWEPLLFWAAPNALPVSDQTSKHGLLAVLGVPLVVSRKPVPGCTHFVTDSASPTPQLLEALVTGKYIVTSDFIDELLSNGTLEGTGTVTLEQEFLLPNPEEHFPNDVSLDDVTFEEVKAKSKPDDKRKNLLKGIIFFVASDDERFCATFDEYEHVLVAAGACVERSTPSQLARFVENERVERLLRNKQSEAQTLSQRSREENASPMAGVLVIITSGHESSEPWYTSLARVSRRLDIPMPAEGLDALKNTILLAAPTRFLNHLAPEQEGDSTSPVAEQANERPDTQIAASASQQQQSPRTSERLSPPVQQLVQPTPREPATPSRRPKRRAGIERVDPFADLFGSVTGGTTVNGSSQFAAVESQVSEIGATQPSPSRASSRPRRNVAGAREQPRRSDVWRSIFEDSAPAASAMTGSASDLVPSTNTQERYTKRFRIELDEADRQASQRVQASESVQEQDADATIQPRQQRKRRAEEEATDERQAEPESSGQIQMAPAPQTEGQPQEVTQASGVPSQGVASSSYIQEQPTSRTQGAGTDKIFLQSIASMKRSKKSVDALDKEFDQLRIARPRHEAATTGKAQHTMLVDQDVLEDPEFRAWQQMTIEDFDIGAAGNFVQVDFVPLLRRRDGQESAHGNICRSESAAIQNPWSGRPNFKKFHAKERPKRAPVALDIVDANDFGVGPRYAAEVANKSTRQQGKTINSRQAERNGAALPSTTQKRSIFKERAEGLGSDEDDEEPLPSRPVEQSTSRRVASTSVRMPDAHKTRGSSSVKRTESPSKKPDAEDVVDLSLDVNDDDPMDDSAIFGNNMGDDIPHRSHPASRSSSTLREDAAPRSATSSRGATSTKRPHNERKENGSADSNEDEVEVDSDDGFTFKGFKRTRTEPTSTRRSNLRTQPSRH